MRLLLLECLVVLTMMGCGAAQSDPSARGREGMVSSATPEATEAGLRVLREGGNAVDAAVAVGFALSVTLPQAGNLGGGGFMVIRMADGRTTTFDFRERAPRAATRDMFLDSAGEFIPERSQIGPLAAGVPGSPAGLLTALEKFGRLDRSKVMAPAIELARKGFILPKELIADITDKVPDFSRFPATAALWTPSGSPPPAGSRFTQPDIAATLERISLQGRDGFYTGTTAEMIVNTMRTSGGIITLEDLRDYQPRERPPIIGTYRGDTIISMPPPSSGGVLLVEMLNMMEGYDFDTVPRASATHAHIITEVMRRAYADRAEHLGDPDYYPVPTAMLLSKRYAAERRATITGGATPSSEVTFGDTTSYPRESNQTTHYSVVDRWGNSVSTTVTLNSSFGNKMIVDGAGFFLNNEMDDFSAKPGTRNLYGLVGNDANAIIPGKRMLSSMTPTIVVRNGRPWLVVGTPGGSTIITTVLQTIHNQIDYGMSLYDAVESPRFHHQWVPDTLYYEPGTFDSTTIVSLHSMGYQTINRGGRSGRVDGIRVDSLDGAPIYIGWSDSRGYGMAQAP